MFPLNYSGSISGADNLEQLFNRLHRYDPSIDVEKSMLWRLRNRRVQPGRYGRKKFFTGMTRGEIQLFSNFPAIPIETSTQQVAGDIQNVLHGWRSAKKLEVRCGPSSTIRYMRSRELIERWLSARGIVNKTDLHVRGSKIETVLDPSRLSWFNLLPGCSGASTQEMMTLVISSTGSVSDSHSDAPDGSNHCFRGSKVWLMWDTEEGRKLGLEDCSRDYVSGRCSFDMKRFLELKSSRWLLITPGHTLFLPGNYTHKVITLEKYLGVGSFYVSLPNCLRTLTRWSVRGPLWSTSYHINDIDAVPDVGPDPALDEIVVEIATAATAAVRRLKSKSPQLKRAWGYDFLRRSVGEWVRTTPKRQQSLVKKLPHFSAYLNQLSNTSG